jgi:transketolase
VKVFDVAVLKPFDPELAVAAARCGAIVTAEEHNRIGGLYSAVLEALAERDVAASVCPVCLHDEFGQSGSWEELRDYYRLNAAGILDAVRRLRVGGVAR